MDVWNYPSEQAMIEIEKVWVACAIDTEGSLGFWHGRTSDKKYSPSIKVDNTNLEFIQKLKDITKKGRIWLEKARVGRKPLYHWQVYRQTDCYEILKEILPFLIVKREKAQNMLLYLRYRRQKGKYSRIGIVEKTLAEGNVIEIKETLELV